MKRESIKQFLKSFLTLALVLLLAVPAWPAALTLSEQNIGTLGPLRVMTGYASTASADTLAFPFKTVLYVGMHPRVTPATQDTPMVWYSISGSTITIYVNTDEGDGTPINDTVRVDYFIIGY